ncbi:hypothetical protein ACA910_017455 [Epithemia clementina (nom. ined.)]
MSKQKGDENDNNTKNNNKHHAFWSTQPMPHGPQGRLEFPEGPIDTPDLDSIRSTPYHMPAGFVWGNVNVSDAAQLDDLYKLLTNNYVEDDDALFRFKYAPEFLVWALTPPGWNPDWLVGVYNEKTHKLMAFISGVPATLQIYQRVVPTVEINFLCVHKKLRSKRLAPVLIKEITRRANVRGIFQAVYTAGTVLPVPVATARYYHRSLHPKKLVHVGFSRLPVRNNARMTLARMIKLYALPTSPVALPQLRPMTIDDVPAVCELLTQYLAKFQLKVLYTHDDIAHWFLPRPGVMNSYVAETTVEMEVGDDDHEDGQDTTTTAATIEGAATTDNASSSILKSDDTATTTKAKKKTKKTVTKITDFISFYHLPSSVLGGGAVMNSNHDPSNTTNGGINTNDTNPSLPLRTLKQKEDDYSTLYAAYSYYNIATSVTLEQLYKDALILAKQEGADVFNALDLMDNTPSTILEPLKFGIGDGRLQYYIYNWSCPAMKAPQVGLVLL